VCSLMSFKGTSLIEIRFSGSVGQEGGTEPVGEYKLFYGKGNENHELGTGFFGS
jgi:hypothetical protein